MSAKSVVGLVIPLALLLGFVLTLEPVAVRSTSVLEIEEDMSGSITATQTDELVPESSEDLASELPNELKPVPPYIPEPMPSDVSVAEGMVGDLIIALENGEELTIPITAIIEWWSANTQGHSM